MKLADYLRSTQITLQAFGRQVGVSHVTVLKWADGRRRPRYQHHMDAIVAATGGAVTAMDFFGGSQGAPPPGFAEAQAPLAPEARALGLNPDAIAAAALRQAIGDEKARRWTEEHRDAIAAYNRYIDENDTLLARYRSF